MDVILLERIEKLGMVISAFFSEAVKSVTTMFEVVPDHVTLAAVPKEPVDWI